MPKRRSFSSVVTNCELVMKFAWFAASDGTARINRKRPISAITPMMVAPAATAIEWKMVSPHRRAPLRRDAGIGVGDIS